MKHLFYFVAVILFACGVRAEPYRLAIFGDSLSSGHGLDPKNAMYSQLEKKLKERGYDVVIIHASKSGETTMGGLAKQERLLSQKPDGVLLELGINDLFRHYDLSITQQNLEKLIVRFQENNIPVLLAGMKVPPGRPQSADFEEMYQTVADKYHLVFYPFFMDGLFDGVSSYLSPNKYLLPDHLHPNAEGVSVMARKILPTVERFLNNQGIFAR